MKDLKDIKVTTSGANSNATSSIEDAKVTTGNVVIEIGEGTIKRPANIASHVDLDTTDYFEERSNPFSSKGN